MLQNGSSRRETWSHCKCVNILVSVASTYPYVCPHCVKSSVSEVSSLKASLKAIECHSLNLVTQFNKFLSSNPSFAPEVSCIQSEIDSIASAFASSNSGHQTSSMASRAASSRSVSRVSPSSSSDKKFNVIIRGVDECPAGTARNLRQSHDLDEAVSVLSSVVSSIDSTSIKDIFRLGKYNSSHHPRPRLILVKLIRSADVLSVLYTNKSSLPDKFSIQPDLSRVERLKYSLLMKERWSLITSGVERRLIKVQNNSIYINNILHGKLDSNNTFVLKGNAASISNDASSLATQGDQTQGDQIPSSQS